MTACDDKSKAMGGRNIFFASLIAGGTAGTCVDAALFPLDTLKTRLQSQHGFLKSGGFRGLYKGLYPVLIGSAPTAALFFVTYESIKAKAQPVVDVKYHAFLHMGAASISEMIACLIRVPVEVLKQRKQALLLDNGALGIKFLYRGYWSTLVRDMPFSLIQFPLWEYFKDFFRLYAKRDTYPIESAACGSLAGAIAAIFTTPLDVAKTRIMLASKATQNSELKLSFMIRKIYSNGGINGLFAGVGYRVIWITLGGFIFFGAYEQAKLTTLKMIAFTNL